MRHVPATRLATQMSTCIINKATLPGLYCRCCSCGVGPCSCSHASHSRASHTRQLSLMLLLITVPPPLGAPRLEVSENHEEIATQTATYTVDWDLAKTDRRTDI